MVLLHYFVLSILTQTETGQQAGHRALKQRGPPAPAAGFLALVGMGSPPVLRCYRAVEAPLGGPFWHPVQGPRGGVLRELGGQWACQGRRHRERALGDLWNWLGVALPATSYVLSLQLLGCGAKAPSYLCGRDREDRKCCFQAERTGGLRLRRR